MKKNPSETEYRTAVILTMAPYVAIIFLTILILLKECTHKIDPLDNSILKQRHIVEIVEVVDSTYNGFEVIYVTTESVTEARLEEIKERRNIKESFDKVKVEAPAYFGHMLYTDIYDFADFVLKYDPDKDIVIHNIFVFGWDKINLYAQPNPKIENYAKWIDRSTSQGVQYLSSADIYYRCRSTDKLYRYWKCFGLNSFSSVDEHYIHFSEDERIQ